MNVINKGLVIIGERIVIKTEYGFCGKLLIYNNYFFTEII